MFSKLTDIEAEILSILTMSIELDNVSVQLKKIKFTIITIEDFENTFEILSIININA